LSDTIVLWLDDGKVDGVVLWYSESGRLQMQENRQHPLSTDGREDRNGGTFQVQLLYGEDLANFLESVENNRRDNTGYA